MSASFQLDPVRSDGAPLRAATVGNRVFDFLRQAIVLMQLRPGDALSEAEVARQLGVSRQPVREAFIKLAEARLIEIRPQRGTYVPLISRREVENARFLREAIEVAIVRRAAADAEAAGLAAIDATLTRQHDAEARGDTAAFMQADDAFHQAIARSVDCEYAWRVLEGLKVQMDRVRYLSMPDATPVETLIAQHQAITDAIEDRAPDAAEAAMRKHLSEILKSLPKIVADYPDLFAD